MKDFLLQLSTVNFVIFIFVVYVSIFLTPFEEETKLFSKDYWKDILTKNIAFIAAILILIGACKFIDYAAHYLAKQ